MNKKQTIALLVLAILGLAGILAAAAIAFTPGHFTAKDTGVTACKTMADNMAKKKTNTKKMTEASYRKARAPFENSKFADIKVAGQNILDTVYQADTQPDPDNIGGAMILLGSLQAQWGQLQTACANHGVTVGPLPMHS